MNNELTPPTLRREGLQSFGDLASALEDHVRWEFEKYNRLHEHLREVIELQKAHANQLVTVREWMSSIQIVIKFFGFASRVIGFLVMFLSGVYGLYKMIHKE